MTDAGPADALAGASVDAPGAADDTPVGGVRIVGPRSKWPRRIRRGLAAALVIGIGYFAVTLWQVHAAGRSDQQRPVDALVVMGAAQYNGRPSPQLQARLDHVVTLWERGVAPVVVVTGGKLPGDAFTEAEASATYLIDHGVPERAILRENEAHNTYDSFVGVAALLRERGLSSVLIVSDPFHLLRSRLIAEEVGLTAFTSPTPTTVVRGRNGWVRELKEAAGVSVGRIIGFGRLSSLAG